MEKTKVFDHTMVMVFNNPEFGKIRVALGENGEPLFCGKDVCDALGYRRADLAVRQHVNPHDAVKRCVSTPIFSQGKMTGKSKRMMMLFVTESGLYALIFGSKLDTAQKFKHWVTSVVLPQIRKTGGYIPLCDGDTEEDIKRRADEILRKTIEEHNKRFAEQEERIAEQGERIAQQERLIHTQQVNIEMKTKLIAEQVERIRGLDKKVDAQLVKIQKSAAEIIDLERDVDRLLPKALYADNVLDSISCYTTTQIAKELGMTAQELNRELCAQHIQYYQSGQYLLYAKYAHLGLAKSRTSFEVVVGEDTILTKMYLVWTEAGRRFIHTQVKGVC